MPQAFAAIIPICMVDVARKIREIRKNMGLTQAEFAAALNASQGSVSKWERGKERPSIEALIALGKVSGFNLNSIRTGHETSYTRLGGLSHIEVVGAIQPNYGVEQIMWDESNRFEICVPTPAYWGKVSLKAWIIKGINYWPNYPVDTVVVTASETNSDEDPEALMQGRLQEVDAEDGDTILCTIALPNGLREITLKRVVAYENGSVALVDLDGFTGPKRPPVPYPSWVNVKAPEVQFLGVAALVIAPVADWKRLVYILEDF